MRHLATVKDVAQVAGVGAMSVSAVLNGVSSKRYVSEATRQRILDAAQELGYRRNEMARTVVMGTSRTLGFWLSDPNYDPFARMLMGVVMEASARDHTVKVFSARAASVAEQVQHSIALRLAGVVLLGYANTNVAAQVQQGLQEYGTPLVILDDSRPGTNCPRVYADDLAACRMVIDHLIDLGHRRIACFNCDDYSGVGSLRRRGFMQALHDRGVEARPDLMVTRDWKTDAAAHGVRQLLAAPGGPPTAICCAGDELAMVAIATARAAGLRVPQDISVTGFSDLATSRLCDPPLTTVISPFEAMGRAAVRCLLDREQGEAPMAEIGVPAGFVARQSSGPPRQVSVPVNPQQRARRTSIGKPGCIATGWRRAI